jgi:NADPH:quinone reductase-like Zn-dependent oxidoreductase
MRGIVLHAPGGLDRLELADMPDPGAPGPGEIRVRLYASSLNYHDYGIVSGRMPTAHSDVRRRRHGRDGRRGRDRVQGR